MGLEPTTVGLGVEPISLPEGTAGGGRVVVGRFCTGAHMGGRLLDLGETLEAHNSSIDRVLKDSELTPLSPIYFKAQVLTAQVSYEGRLGERSL